MSQRTAKWEDLKVGTKLYSPEMFAHSVMVTRKTSEGVGLEVSGGPGGPLLPFWVLRRNVDAAGWSWKIDPAEIETKPAPEELKP